MNVDENLSRPIKCSFVAEQLLASEGLASMGLVIFPLNSI
jgi:hypothetical protein